MMNLNLQQTQKKEKNLRNTVSARTCCPRCRSTSLLSEGVDQFCLSCDWDTCAEYVERGLMNNLELAFREHFKKPRDSERPEKQSPVPATSQTHLSNFERTA